MRVLWLSPFSGNPASGDTGGWVSALAGALARHSTLELAFAVPAPARSLIKERDAQGRVRYQMPSSDRGPSRAARLVRRQLCLLDHVRGRDLAEVVNDARPDLVHVFGTESALGLVQDIVELPVLISLQGSLTASLPCFFGGLGAGDILRYGQKRRLLAGTSLLHRYRRYARGAGRERRILGKALYLTGRTAWDREIAERLAPQARYFPCDEVLREDFYRTTRRPGADSEPLEILTTVRSNPYKGLETVLLTAHRLREDGLRFHWRVAGVRPDEEIAVVCRRKFGLDFEHNAVHLLGSLGAGPLASLLEQADLYVHPTWIDNSPNALCEAMLAGVPVVATDVGGIPSLLVSGREGLTVPAGDVEALAAAIRELRSRPDRARSLASNARQRAEHRHDPDRVGAVLTGIYTEILGTANAPARSQACAS